MKKRQCLVLIAGLLVGLLLGCEGRDRAGAGAAGAAASMDGQGTSNGNGPDERPARGSATVVDLAGRTVEIPTGAVKVVLGDLHRPKSMSTSLSAPVIKHNMTLMTMSLLRNLSMTD